MTTPKTCSYCGLENGPALKYCAQCGTALPIKEPPREAPAPKAPSAGAPFADTGEYMGRLILWEPATRSAFGFRRYDTVKTLDNTGSGKLVVTSDAILLLHRRVPIKVLCMVLLFPVWGLAGMALGEGVFNLAGKSILTQGWTQVGCMALLGWGTWQLLGFPLKGLRRRFPLASVVNARLQVVTGAQPGRWPDCRGVSLAILPSGLSGPDGGVIAELPDQVPASACGYLSFLPSSAEPAQGLMRRLPRAVVPLTGEQNPYIPPQQGMPWRGSAEPQGLSVHATRRPVELTGLNGPKSYLHDVRRSSLWQQAAVALFFGALLTLLLSTGLVRDRGVIINGIIRLGPAGATVLSFLGMALIAGFFLTSVASLLQRLFNPHSLVLGEDSITFMEGFLKPLPRRVKFSEIHSMSEHQPVGGGSRTLCLLGLGQKSTISEALLPSPKDYEEIKAVLNRKMAGSYPPEIK